MKKYLSIIVVVIIILLTQFLNVANAIQPRNSRTVTFQLQNNIYLTGPTTKVFFRMVVPQTIKNHQDILSVKFEPNPEKVYMLNGTKYAEFTILNPQKDFSIRATCQANIYQYDFETATKTQDRLITTPKQLTAYLKAEPYLESNHPQVKAIANQLNTSDQIETIKKIYNYVLNNFSYSTYNPGDVGALKALQVKKGDCTEYSDIMVALCRANNIPAREIYGFTIDWNNTPKHNWVEVYTSKYGWIPFDPTLGDGKKNTFSKLQNIYVYMSDIRKDQNLYNFFYSSYNYWGAPIKLDDRFVIIHK